MTYRLALAAAVVAAGLVAAVPAVTRAQTPPTPTPSDTTPSDKSGPADTPGDSATPPIGDRDHELKLLLDLLEKEHTAKLKSGDWLTRALTILPLSRIPTKEAFEQLIQTMEKDRNDVVRLLAWQAVLARAQLMDYQQHDRLLRATEALGGKGAFHGDMRVAMLNVLATGKPTSRAQKVWQQTFVQASAYKPEDIATLDALGRTLKVWRNGKMVEQLIRILTDQDAGVRAEYVLRQAGITPRSAMDLIGPSLVAGQRTHPDSKNLWQAVQKIYADYYNGEKNDWRDAPEQLASVRELKPLWIDPPQVTLDEIDPQDKSWRDDLELGKAELDHFQVVFVMDATGSMGDVLDWLRSDIARVSQAFNMVGKKPSELGMVFYRDQGDAFLTSDTRLSSQLKPLSDALLSMTADGGGDVPEAVENGLEDAYTKMDWSSGMKPGSQIVILLGDAPPKPGSTEKCVEMSKAAASKGIETYAIALKTKLGDNDLTDFGSIATAGGTQVVDVTFGGLSDGGFVDGKGKPLDIRTIAAPEAQLLVAKRAEGEKPGDKVMVQVLSSAINKTYKDRVAPLARTILAFAEPTGQPEKRIGFPANTNVGQGTSKPQG